MVQEPEEGWVVKLTKQLTGEKIVPDPTYFISYGLAEALSN